MAASHHLRVCRDEKGERVRCSSSGSYRFSTGSGGSHTTYTATSTAPAKATVTTRGGFGATGHGVSSAS